MIDALRGVAGLERLDRVLARHADAVAALSDAWPPSVAGLTRWRDELADDLPVALALAEARVRSSRRFPGLAALLVSDPEALEQASSEAAAAHKAARFARLAPPRIVDLCSGAGLDARALAAVAPVLGVDLEPARARMTQRNAGCSAIAADATALALRGVAVHLDPSRRAGGKRLHDFADYRPGPAFVEDLLERCPDSAIKCGPGIEFDELPLGPDREVEVIGEPQGLTQAVLWSGALARNRGLRTATRLPEGVSFSGEPDVRIRRAAEVGPLLFAVDAAVERASLVGALAARRGLRSPHPGTGLLTGADDPGDPFLPAYAVEADLPWQEKKVRAWLRKRSVRAVEVKTRGVRMDANTVQRALQKKLDRDPDGVIWTLFLVRFDRAPRAILARRLRAAASAE